jgi:hypothetical protein
MATLREDDANALRRIKHKTFLEVICWTAGGSHVAPYRLCIGGRRSGDFAEHGERTGWNWHAKLHGDGG